MTINDSCDMSALSAQAEANTEANTSLPYGKGLYISYRGKALPGRPVGQFPLDGTLAIRLREVRILRLNTKRK